MIKISTTGQHQSIQSYKLVRPVASTSSNCKLDSTIRQIYDRNTCIERPSTDEKVMASGRTAPRGNMLDWFVKPVGPV